MIIKLIYFAKNSFYDLKLKKKLNESNNIMVYIQQFFFLLTYITLTSIYVDDVHYQRSGTTGKWKNYYLKQNCV